jgi:hypothetical protein
MSRDRNILAKKRFLNNESIKHNVIPRQSITAYNKKPTIEQLNPRSNWSWGALLAALGLGSLWYNSEEKEEVVEQEQNALLKRCQLSYVDPLYEFSQFIKKYRNKAAAEQLFEKMITDDSILSNMRLSSIRSRTILPSVVPFVQRHYYTLACSDMGSYVLGQLMESDKASKKELTFFAIRDMEKLCEHAESDAFFRDLLVDNPEAVNGLVKKAEGRVEQLIATKAGKDLIDKSLITQSMNVAKERATLLADPSKTFDLRAFNTCMANIKDDPRIEEMIKRSYKSDDFSSLLRKIVYQKYCQHCTKDDLSHASVSLKSLATNIDYLASVNTYYDYVVPDKGLSHMVVDALNKEDKYQDDYYVFYHGQPSTLGFQQRLFSWLVTKNDEAILPIIYPLPRTKQEQLADEELLNKRKGSMYHQGGDRTHSLYAVVDLFSNITLRLAACDSSCATMPSITTEQACQDAHQEKMYASFKNELEELEHAYDKLHKKGQLLQFRVKKDKLEQYVFASKDQVSLQVEGRDYVSDLRSILHIFRNNPEKIMNRDFSVGISIGSHLSDPKSGIACSIINSVDPTEWAVYEKKEKALKNKIDHYLKTGQQVKASLYAVDVTI